VKILYHHRTLGDGAEGIHIAEMVSALRAAGHDVHVHGLAASGNAPARRVWIDRFRQHVPHALFELAALASNALDYLQVRRAIRVHQPDLMYKRHGRNDVGALYAAAHGRVPVAIEINCLYTGAQYERFEPLPFKAASRFLERQALRMGRWRFAVSTPLARDVDALDVGATVVVPNGADAVAFDPARTDGSAVRARYGLGDAVIVGWTGVIRDWHGLDLLLEAITPLSGARLLIVGDGPGRPAIESRAQSLGIAGRVAITGRVPHDEMPAHVAAMDVAVVADDRTGVASPMKLLEYMAMARAVVAPRLPNIEDVIVDGATGVLFTPGDAASLADALVTLAGAPAVRARLGRAARESILRERTWQRNAARVLEHVGPRSRETGVQRRG